MFLLRAAVATDLDALLALARLLDSPNLPHDADFLRARLERSEASFAELGPPSAGREYQLVLEDTGGRVVGTSAVLSKHGTPELPHTYLRVRREERCAQSVDVSVNHCTLQLGSSDDGPSELGSLVLLPHVRGAAGSPGKLLSWGRLAFIARHPGCFERQLLAEMRASLDADGRNAFWDAFGGRFTGMDYAEADRRSANDKGFILDLFPDTPFYTALLPDDVVAELGQVHPEARAALRLLEAAGLHWIGEIDPFDAGPFIGAETSEVLPIRETRSGPLAADALDADAEAPLWIAASEEDGRFRAVATAACLDPAGRVHLPKEAARRLDVQEDDELSLTPLPPRRAEETRDG
jgi:arginine N-succinyltransferase